MCVYFIDGECELYQKRDCPNDPKYSRTFKNPGNGFLTGNGDGKYNKSGSIKCPTLYPAATFCSGEYVLQWFSTLITSKY